MSNPQNTASDEMTDAINIAREFLLKAFKDENIENVSLEEVKHTGENYWDITLGFTRTPNTIQDTNKFLQLAAAAAAARPRRIYKVARVDVREHRGISITNRADD